MSILMIGIVCVAALVWVLTSTLAAESNAEKRRLSIPVDLSGHAGTVSTSPAPHRAA